MVKKELNGEEEFGELYVVPPRLDYRRRASTDW